MCEGLHQSIEMKERSIARLLTLQVSFSTRLVIPYALHNMLEIVTLWEWSLVGCFASSTPLTLVHKCLADKKPTTGSFDVELFFEASSSTIDLMLNFVKALAASGCTRA